MKQKKCPYLPEGENARAEDPLFPPANDPINLSVTAQG